MAKRLTLRQHIAKMVDVCGPSYGPIVGLVCFKVANPKGAKDKLSYDLLMPDPRLALTTYPWYATGELRTDWHNVIV